VKLVIFAMALTACGSSPPWEAKDTVSGTHSDQLAKGCEALCLSDAGCTSDQAAGCFDAIGCNLGSMLHRHGAASPVAADAGCLP